MKENFSLQFALLLGRGMEINMKKKFISVILSLGIIGSFWIPFGSTVHAEETMVPGYHEYVETESESIDHWYAISRGTYLKEGISGIKDSGKGRVSVSGTTFAHVICDTIRVSIYLDESTDGGNSFGQIGSYYFSENDTATCYGNKTNISATSGRYYMVRGGHSATKGSNTEMTTTQTKTLKCS